ncbi:MAG: DUF2461 domain-containing protein [Bacteroidota bacterium]
MYFTTEFIRFFEELSENNHRDWFQANKPRFENQVKKPFVAFVSELINRVQQDDPLVTIEPKEAMFRIYRDVRFSKDKAPYKTHMSAVISPKGRKDHGYPGLYVQMNHENIALAGGGYQLDKEQLYRLRTLIASQPKRFQELIEDPEFTSRFGELQGKEHKRIPKEFKEAVADQPLLMKKQMYYWTEIDREHITSPQLVDLLMEYYEAAKLMKAFFTEAMVG